MSKQSNLLDVQENVLEKKLKFVDEKLEKELDKYFGAGTKPNESAPPRSYKVVHPKPGFCIKSYRSNSEDKYFLNICQTEDIPAPEDVTEEQLRLIVQAEDSTNFRIPMSIAEPRYTKDNSNNPVEVCDIAINPRFYAKCQKSDMFREFLMALIAEALSEKYNVQLDLNKTKNLNRSHIGTLVPHRVRTADVQSAIDYIARTGNPLSPTTDAETLQGIGTGKRAPLVQDVTNLVNEEPRRRLPVYRVSIKREDERPVTLIAEFHLPDCPSGESIKCDVGDSRIMIQSEKYGYFFDKSFDMELDTGRSTVTFNIEQHTLCIQVSIKDFATI